MHASRIAAIAIAACALPPGSALAQDAYPSKLVRIVTSSVGGNADVLARFIAPGLSTALGQQVIVDNRGAIAPAVAAKSAPDGYTLLVNGSPQWLLPLLRPGTPWDAVKEFAPVTLATNSPSLLVIHPSVPVKTVAQLIALAKARPGELFKSMARINVVRVGYKGTGPGVVGVMTGESQFMFPGAPAAMPYVKQGRLRALAVCSAEPSALAPGIPTVAATGLPGFESVSPQAVFAPAGTPPAIVDRLQREIAKVLNAEDLKQKLFASGSEVVVSTPKVLADTMRRDIDRISRLVKETGLREE